MVLLVTLDQAKAHLRVDTSDGDADITLKILAASNAVLNYLKTSGVAYEYEVDSAGDVVFDSAGTPVYTLDSAGELVPLPAVQAAVLLMLGVLYIDRDGEAYVGGEQGPRLGDRSLPQVVHWLLDPLRKPTLQ